MNSHTKFLSQWLFGMAGAIALHGAVAQATGPLAAPNPAVAPRTNPQGHDAAPSSNGNTPIGPRAPALPPSVDAGQMAASSPDSRQMFAQLDRAHRGWLNKSDVSSNLYLARHFGDCDANHDQRLSRDEVDACMTHERQQSN